MTETRVCGMQQTFLLQEMDDVAEVEEKPEVAEVVEARATDLMVLKIRSPQRKSLQNRGVLGSGTTSVV